MPSIASKVRTSAGTTLAVCAPATPPASYDAATLGALTYIPVGELSDLGSFGKKYNLVTFAPLAARNVVKRKGSYNNGTLSLKLGAAPTDLGQVALQTASTSDSSLYFCVTTQAGNKFYFSGQVMSWVLEVGSVDQIMGASCEVELDNDVIPQTAPLVA